jgi:hypothetical protein
MFTNWRLAIMNFTQIRIATVGDGGNANGEQLKEINRKTCNFKSCSQF